MKNFACEPIEIGLAFRVMEAVVCVEIMRQLSQHFPSIRMPQTYRQVGFGVTPTNHGPRARRRLPPEND